MGLCDECRKERNEWIDAVQDLAASQICKPLARGWPESHGAKRPPAYRPTTAPFIPGQRGAKATAIVRAQIKLIETVCAREHQGGVL